MKGLEEIILAHYQTHQLADFKDTKVREQLTKLLVKKIKILIKSQSYSTNIYGDDEWMTPSVPLSDESE
tara:strand:+ start:658 stop:864 length:207 start_codon:yes stop_codon:yes gene_type:complete